MGKLRAASAFRDIMDLAGSLRNPTRYTLIHILSYTRVREQVWFMQFLQVSTRVHYRVVLSYTARPELERFWIVIDQFTL